MKKRLVVALAVAMWLAGSQHVIANDSELKAIRLVFGVYDTKPTAWDGSISISEGEIVKISGYHFGKDDKVTDNHSWAASTRSWQDMEHWGAVNQAVRPLPRPTLVDLTGVNVYYRGPETATFRLKLKQPRKRHSFLWSWTAEQHDAAGLKFWLDEFKFRPMDIPEWDVLPILSARIQVYRVPPVERLTGPEHEDDHPSLAVEKNGDVWMAWIGYKNPGDTVFVRRGHKGVWSEPAKLTERPGDFFGSTAAVDGLGRLWVIWSERIGADWQLVARSYSGDWSSTQQLTSGRGNNIFHRLISDRKGNLHLVWQGFRDGRSDIFLMSLIGDKWSSEINLSDPKKGRQANDWRPAVASDSKSRVWVAWDSYDTGSYNILLRPVKDGKPGKLIKVTNSSRFHANPTLAVDDDDRLWVAYEESDENWGKDYGLLLTGGSPIYCSRSIRFAIFSDGKWFEPRDDLSKRVPPGVERFMASPHLTLDGRGRMWVIFRPRTNAEMLMDKFGALADWEVMASYYSGDRWSAPIVFPESAGRNECPLDAVAASDGRVSIAWAVDHGPHWDLRTRPDNADIMFATVTASPDAAMSFGQRSTEPPTRKQLEPHEKEQVAKIRNYTIRVGGKTYRIYRGDLHHHSEISSDGANEGSLLDVYRYFIDAANLDFGATTDHGDYDDYQWWRTMKVADMFHIPGCFTPLFAYERSVPNPNGHRNLIFAHRGKRLLPLEPKEVKGELRSGPIIYPYLRENHGIAIPHTSATSNMGTDWGDNHHDLDPVVEIFQGERTSAEHEGAPLAPGKTRPDFVSGEAGGYQDSGWVWNAWAKGYKLGVIASSDHVSTHISYACVISEDGSREGLIDAMRKRHAYGATSNIILDYRMWTSRGQAIMGDDTSSKTIPELYVKVIATAPIKEVVIIRDNQYIERRNGSGEEIEFRYKEETLAPGEHYYYARVEQIDGHVAWASPVWVTYQP
ncbi:MAG: DUF3604 domain-containing protein [Armatimonadetes bacterium]|nr:DUF3604 domain-containing protein [Armatimonadota bacterium]